MEGLMKAARRRFQAFKKGTEDPLAVAATIRSTLTAARKAGDDDLVEELEDMLIDLLCAIEENKCSCHKNCPAF